LLLGLAQALQHRQAPPDPDAFQAALHAFISDTEGLRSDVLVQKLPGETFGQVFALGFAFEQFRKDLGDLLARTEELALRSTPEAAER
jgi:hypothetical protein